MESDVIIELKMMTVIVPHLCPEAELEIASRHATF
jgi:hypothetical protein